MNDFSAVSRLPVQPLEPDLDAPMDELEESLVPVEEDELPQGVLDLVAALIGHHRPTMAAGSREPLAPAKGERTERPLSPHAQTVTLHQRPVPLFGALLQQPAQPRMASVAPAIERGAMREARSEAQRPVIEQTSRLPELSSIGRPPFSVEASSIDRLPLSVESSSIDRPAPAIEPAIPVSDLELHAGQSNLQVMRNAPPVSLPVAAPTPAPPSTPPPEARIEQVAGSSGDFLHIPFNKGTASGQVMIARMPGESAQNLVLTPSSVQIFEQLEAPFERAQEPHWRLTDTGDEQQHHGSRQSPDDEETDQQERPA